MQKIIVDKNLLRTLVNLASVVETRDVYTGGHIWRVSQYSKLLAQQVGMSNEEINIAELGGLIHDLGKVGIADDILNKKGPLDDHEFDVMKTHTSVGKKLIEYHPLAPVVMDAICNHHERVDGSGYPEGIKSDENSIFGRITSVADAFDAMTSTRPYRKALSIEEALNRIEQGLGTQFDDTLGRKFIELGYNGVLEGFVGHFNFGKKLLSCPVCGPIISYDSQFKDGDNISCSHCNYEMVMHKSKDTFELQPTGNYNPLKKTNGDNEVIDEFTKGFVEKISMY